MQVSIESSTLPTVIALAGPTGSGKTGLGVALARAFDTEIISVDSMAVYRGMDIGTAKPSLEERGGVVHHLLDVVDPDAPFTAADFVRLAGPAIEGLHRRGRPAVLVGGTGLYLRALLHGIFEGPGPDDVFRRSVLEAAAAEAAAGASDPLHRRLQAVDLAAAERLHPRDHFRIVRALEVFHATGRPLSVWQAEHAFAESRYRWMKLMLEIPRDELYRRIDARVIDMVARGLEAETAALLERFGPDVKPMKGLGYLHFVQVLTGAWSREDAIALMQRDTRRFARRQLTWFRGERGVRAVAPDLGGLLAEARKFVES